MANILEINNWDQLVRAKSDYANLGILVTEYSNGSITGTKIQVADKDNNDIYLTLFTNIQSSSRFPVTASMELDEIVRVINLYGFNVRISVPTPVPENVITILQGLYAAGYQYVYKDYIIGRNCNPLGYRTEYGIYVSDQIKIRRHDPCMSNTPDYVPDDWDWCEAFKTYPIKNIIDTGSVDNGLPIESVH